MVNRERGHTMMALIITVSVVAMLTGAALTGGNAHFAMICRSYGELQATEAATDRLETIVASDAAPVTGEREFETSAGLSGTETVTEVGPGLYEVRVRVTRPGARPAVLTTRMAHGGKR